MIAKPLFAVQESTGYRIVTTRGSYEAQDLCEFDGSLLPVLSEEGPAIYQVLEACWTVQDWSYAKTYPSKCPPLFDYLWMCRHRGISVKYT